MSEGSAENPPKGMRPLVLLYVVAKATMHKDFRAQRLNSQPEAMSHRAAF
ncbi:MAG: hypothetical protein WCD43_12885 [Candidatus Acidiferrales bacterium]